MTDIYTQENGSKKKFLAPVLVILLCMVSLTAAGYAYSATVDNTGDDVIIEGLTMELKEGSVIVDHPMFVVGDENGIDIATHTVNGKAAKAGGQAVLDTDKSFVTYDKDDLDSYADGYFVEVYKNYTHVEYAAPAEAYTAESIATQAAANPCKGVYQIGPNAGYTLSVNNQSDKTVDVKMLVSGDLTGFKGIKNLYITVIGNDISKIFDVKAGLDLTILDTLADGNNVSYTIKAFIVLSDYYSEDVPELPVENIFDISFSAVTAA